MRESFTVRASKQQDMHKIKETPIPINIKKGIKGRDSRKWKCSRVRMNKIHVSGGM